MKTILIIEDDTVLRETTAEILELENYKVVTAANGKRGAELAKILMPDLVVCDIMMPELDGYDVLKILSEDEKTKRIPFIFMSAKTEIKDVRKGMDLGADDYLTKPVNDELLISAIESRLAKSALLQEEETNIETSNEASEFKNIENIDDLKNYFCDFGISKVLKKGEVVYREGEFCNNVFLVYKGSVKSSKIDEFGKELIINVYKDDDLFGFSSIIENAHYFETTTAMEKAELMYVTKNTMQKIIENNYKLSLEIFQLINDNLIEVKEQLLQMAYGSMRRKTASTILKFAQKMTRKPSDNINISRRDLAGVAGIATESLIRTLTDLKKEGIIEIEGRNIRIVDLNALESIN
ncbi:response regulator [Lutibacter maritimus]|uniref:cAMP-binding domain of CRP or a regulatory subunit of cAMP-dependent protein kinases n=1 Tax=Lutibacter maritimus TaxID=593133 RepID=A0A1I6PT02_9FLAO|nr:response regulator [Lutibacter maritimus]SFS43343.1 cAMP-binding domain of CRP or a regulatory subunit of cAMP-dependent protein kinases [Lutibacter maritimus]